jgi:hypothetical protein
LSIIGNVLRADSSRGQLAPVGVTIAGRSGTTPAEWITNPAVHAVTAISASAQRSRRRPTRHTAAATPHATSAVTALVSRVSIQAVDVTTSEVASRPRASERRRPAGNRIEAVASAIAAATSSAASESLIDSDSRSSAHPTRTGASKNASATTTAATRARGRRTHAATTTPRSNQAPSARCSCTAAIAPGSPPIAR